MRPRVKVAFASGTEALNGELVQRMLELFPDLPLYVVSEFPPEQGTWIPYHVQRGLPENWRRCRAALAGTRIRLAGVLLVPGVPYRRMRLIALLLSPVGFLAFNEHLGSFMLRPRCVRAIARHILWRAGNWARWHWQRFRNRDWQVFGLRWRARWLGVAGAAGRLLPRPRAIGKTLTANRAVAGISVVIPSRDGRELLAAQLPGLLAERPLEVIVVDNGSHDGTLDWLRAVDPAIAVEHSAPPLSFARAVNLGIRRARGSHVCLLNNDMRVEPGFLSALADAFQAVPDLFCATAQILFPGGVRREETGKAVMAEGAPEDFPVRCLEPLEGEDLSYVLYGSGGCSLYDAGKLRALGSVSEIYEPAYVEDLDLGYRAWQRGWPSVFVNGARVEHRHRTTTSRYYTLEQLAEVLEVNYLRFLWTAVAEAGVFRRLWSRAIARLHRRALKREAAALAALDSLSRLPPAEPPHAECSEEVFLALASGDVAVFPGRRATGKPVVLIASPWPPFPLSHGAAVRMFNLAARAAADYDQVLVTFCERLETPPAELRQLFCEVVAVKRAGTHALPSSRDPDGVLEFRSAAFRGALRQTMAKWKPRIAQLELTQMAQYAGDCSAAKTLLVEHDITFDLYQQLAALHRDWETERQLRRWRRFEVEAWGRVNGVITMSERDRAQVTAARVATLPNGVDLDRFQPSDEEPEPGRLLFIGSFAHLPNLLALEFFLDEVWPRLQGVHLHVIAGRNPQYYREHYRERVTVRLELPGVEVEGLVADVRPAYHRAALVIAPLVASAGTNIKVLEAMAMGKAVVTTPAGIHGLDVAAGVRVVRTGPDMANAIRELLDDARQRRAVETRARRCVERQYCWETTYRAQKRLYDSL